MLKDFSTAERARNIPKKRHPVNRDGSVTRCGLRCSLISYQFFAKVSTGEIIRPLLGEFMSAPAPSDSGEIRRESGTPLMAYVAHGRAHSAQLCLPFSREPVVGTVCTKCGGPYRQDGASITCDCGTSTSGY